jgi:hypothetical protein
MALPENPLFFRFVAEQWIEIVATFTRSLLLLDHERMLVSPRTLNADIRFKSRRSDG